MAFRFKLNSQQPQYGYNPVSPLAQAFGNFVNAYMSGPSSYEVDKMVAERDLARLKQEEYTRKFGGYDAISGAFAPGPDGAPPKFDPSRQAQIYADAARAGLDPDKAGGWGRIFTTTTGAPQSAQDQSVYAVAPWSNTKGAFDESQATEIKKANISAGATIQAANIAEAGRMARRYDTPFAASPGSGVFFSPGDTRFAGVAPGDVPVPKVLEPHNVPQGTAVFPMPGDPRFAGVPSGSVPVPKPIDPQSPVGKLMADRDRLPPGHPDRARYDDAIAKSVAAHASERSQKIEALTRQGFSQDDAAAIVDGVKEIKVDQSSGRVLLVDKRDPMNVQEVPVKPAQVGPRVQVPPAPPPGASRPRLADTTGVLPSIADTISGTVGQVIPSAASPQITRNRQDLGIISELAVDALLKNSRAPVAEQDRIRKLLPTAGVFTSATEASAKMEELRALTVRRIEADTALLNAPVPYSREARQEAEERLRKSDLLLREIDRFSSGGTPAAPPTGGPTPQGPTGQQGAAPPPGSLKSGVHTTFANGQVWTLGPDGQPQRVR